MGKINFGRVLLGGLVAGLILNVGEWVLNGIVLHQQMQEFFKRCGFPEPGTNFLVIAVAITFVLGIVIVLGYAAIRPRFGPRSQNGDYRRPVRMVRRGRLPKRYRGWSGNGAC